MRGVSILMLTLLIQMGLFGRVLAIIPCCSEVHIEDCDHHNHDDSHDEHEDSSSETRPETGTGHHHAKCVHNLLVPTFGVGDPRLTAPHADSISQPRHHTRPPDKPFLALAKPPLI